jgi:TraX protein.
MKRLNRNHLKYLAIVAMVVDHVAWAFVPTVSLLGQLMHLFGRLTGPLMAFFLAEGYAHTRDVKNTPCVWGSLLCSPGCPSACLRPGAPFIRCSA